MNPEKTMRKRSLSLSTKSSRYNPSTLSDMPILLSRRKVAVLAKVSSMGTSKYALFWSYSLGQTLVSQCVKICLSELWQDMCSQKSAWNFRYSTKLSNCVSHSFLYRGSFLVVLSMCCWKLALITLLNSVISSSTLISRKLQRKVLSPSKKVMIRFLSRKQLKAFCLMAHSAISSGLNLQASEWETLQVLLQKVMLMSSPSLKKLWGVYMSKGMRLSSVILAQRQLEKLKWRSLKGQRGYCFLFMVTYSYSFSLLISLLGMFYFVEPQLNNFVKIFQNQTLRFSFTSCSSPCRHALNCPKFKAVSVFLKRLQKQTAFSHSISCRQMEQTRDSSQISKGTVQANSATSSNRLRGSLCHPPFYTPFSLHIPFLLTTYTFLTGALGTNSLFLLTFLVMEEGSLLADSRLGLMVGRVDSVGLEGGRGRVALGLVGGLGTIFSLLLFFIQM